MATQQNAKTTAGLVLQGMRALKGVQQLGAEVGLQDMEVTLQNGLTAVNEAIDECAKAKAAEGEMRFAFKTAFRSLRDGVKASMTLFKLTFGGRWNSGWESLALPVGSVEVPTRKEKVLAMGMRIRSYLGSNAGMESAAHGVTAANMAERISAVETAQHGVDSAKAAVRKCIAVREAAAKELARILTVLRTRLSCLAKDDVRWLEFGYSRPCDPAIPDVPQEVTAAGYEPGAQELALSWSRSPRADRYKVYAQVKGSEEAPALMATTPLTEARITGLTAGTPYVITVTAVNNGGESLPSVGLEVTA